MYRRAVTRRYARTLISAGEVYCQVERRSGRSVGAALAPTVRYCHTERIRVPIIHSNNNNMSSRRYSSATSEEEASTRIRWAATTRLLRGMGNDFCPSPWIYSRRRSFYASATRFAAAGNDSSAVTEEKATPEPSESPEATVTESPPPESKSEAAVVSNEASMDATATPETEKAAAASKQPKDKGGSGSGSDNAAAKKKALKEKYLKEQAAKEQAAKAKEAENDAPASEPPKGDNDLAARKKALEEKAADKKGEAAAAAAATTTTPPVATTTAAANESVPSDEKTATASATSSDGKVDSKAAKDDAPSPTSTDSVGVGGPPIVDGVKQYSTPELTADAAKHKAGLDDPTRPDWQNPLHHNNAEMAQMFREDFATDEAFEAAQNPAPPLDDGSGRVVAPDHLHALADEMVHLTMLEMNELINRISDHYGFTDGMFTPDSGDGSSDGADGGDDDDGSGGGAAAAAAEKTTFDVKLVSYDASIKIKIIKEVRVIVPGLGLKEAKELVEGVPVALQKGVSKDVADQIKAKMDELGAVTEIV